MRALLFTLVFILGLAVVAQWWGWSREANEQVMSLSRGDQGVAIKSQVVLSEHIPLGPVEEYMVIADRPLFNSGRRPVVPEEVVTVPVETAEFPLQLSGIVITPDGRQALVMDKVTKQITRLSEGDSFQQWKVDQIAMDKLVLISQGKQEELLLRVYPDVPVAPPPKKSPRRAVQGKRKAVDRVKQRQEQEGVPPRRSSR